MRQGDIDAGRAEGLTSDEREELRRLRRENRRLQQEREILKARGFLRAGDRSPVMCFRLIDAKRAQHPVSLLCSVLGVSRAGYYAWKDRPRSLRARRHEELTVQIRQIHDKSEGSYGWRAALDHADAPRPAPGKLLPPPPGGRPS